MLRWQPPRLSDQTDEEYKKDCENRPNGIPVFWNLDRYLAYHIAERLEEFYKFSFEDPDDMEKSIIDRLKAYAVMPYVPIDNDVTHAAQEAFMDLGGTLPRLWY